MRHRLQAPKGKKRYALRKQVVEPVLGNIKSMLGFRQCLLRGLDQVRTECSLVTMSWNIYQADVRPGDGETEPNCQCLRASHALSGCPVPIANEIPILRPLRTQTRAPTAIQEANLTQHGEIRPAATPDRLLEGHFKIDESHKMLFRSRKSSHFNSASC
jgi:Transposase DDE domain